MNSFITFAAFFLSSRSLSTCFFSCFLRPRATAISHFSFPFSEKIFSGTMVVPFSLVSRISLLISFLFSSNFRDRDSSCSSWLNFQRETEQFSSQTSPPRTVTQADLRLACPARSDLTSQPCSTIPAVKLSFRSYSNLARRLSIAINAIVFISGEIATNGEMAWGFDFLRNLC